jgi:hypothetical protein
MRDLFKRVGSLEEASGLVAADALRTDVSTAERIAHIEAVCSRLVDWRATCLTAFDKRGEPHGWLEYQMLRTFTQSVIMVTRQSRESAAPPAEWFWDVLHAVYLARHAPGWGRPLRIDGRDAPIESSLMAALLADGDDVLADVEIKRSRVSGPWPSSLWELWGIAPPGGLAADDE